MYYHFKKLQAANPCTEMTGFTRMLNSVGAKPDGLMDEIPTVGQPSPEPEPSPSPSPEPEPEPEPSPELEPEPSPEL